MKLFCSNYWQNPLVTATVHYFRYNSHHHYHFHYHCKMHLYCLKILLTIPLCNMIPCLLYRHIFFFSLIPSFLIFTPSKRIQNWFTTIRQTSNFTGKHLCQSFFLIKLQTWDLQLYQKQTPTQVFSCKICENFKNTLFLQNTSGGCFCLHFLIYTIYLYLCSLYTNISTWYQLDKIDKIWGI